MTVRDDDGARSGSTVICCGVGLSRGGEVGNGKGTSIVKPCAPAPCSSSSRLTVRRLDDPGELENRTFRDVAFEPRGTYAVLVGDRGAVFRYVPSR